MRVFGSSSLPLPFYLFLVVLPSTFLAPCHGAVPARPPLDAPTGETTACACSCSQFSSLRVLCFTGPSNPRTGGAAGSTGANPSPPSRAPAPGAAPRSGSSRTTITPTAPVATAKTTKQASLTSFFAPSVAEENARP